MADSIITKQALASSLKASMNEMPFEKINVAHICERCGMNRKSFYYHFKDKYDLVNWIFDTEFVTVAIHNDEALSYDDRKEYMLSICRYFYENRDFYRNALKIKGQNSFSDHFREYCYPVLKTRITSFYGGHMGDEFTVNFFVDALMCAMERWLQERDCMPPEEFVSKLILLIENGAASVYREMGRS